MIPTFDDPDLKNDIQCLEEKREVLQQIIEIAKAIENMQESLDSVLVLGLPSRDMPASAMATFDSISESLKSLPVNKLTEYLNNLERLVKSQLNRVLGYAGVDFERDEGIEFLTISDGENGQSPVDLLEDFSRTAQTTVSLRVLLRKRGVPTPGAEIEVPRLQIEQKLGELQQHEERQRARIGDKVVEIRDDVRAMIDNPNYPDAMKQMLRGVEANLSADLRQIENGAPIAGLSFVADEGDEILAVDAAPEVEETEEIVLAGPAPEPEAEDHSSGLAARASACLNSPWDVSWDDIEPGK